MTAHLHTVGAAGLNLSFVDKLLRLFVSVWSLVGLGRLLGGSDPKRGDADQRLTSSKRPQVTQGSREDVSP